jgi:hypothetical protein
MPLIARVVRSQSCRKRWYFGLALAVCFGVLVGLPAWAQTSFPRLLPPADYLRLTLREDSRSRLPLGPSCTGEASRTLTCRAFTATLENQSKQTIRLAYDCREPRLVIERKLPDSSTGWWPVSQRQGCRTVEWTNVRLEPGQSTVMEVRLISPTRDGDALLPGFYTLRASLTLFGCTESSKRADCLAPLEAVPKPPSMGFKIDFQEPVIVVSNEIVAKSPKLDLGEMSFGFEIEVLSDAQLALQGRKGCTPENKLSIDCMVFKYRILNLSARPVRNATFSCGGSGIAPEYRNAEGQWTALPPCGYNLTPPVIWSCTENVLVETPILSGKALEGEFTLRALAPESDLTPLRSAGEHQLRFRFFPSACFASPDGRFCITGVEPGQPSVVSSEITVHSP